MIIPLIQVRQKNEYIYTSKMKVKDMKEYVRLNFRYPYIDNNSNSKSSKKLYEYIHMLEKRGLNVDYSENGMQRQIQIDRLNQIASFIEEINNIIPNAIILGCYDKRIEQGKSDKDYQKQLNIINEELGIFSLDLNKNHEMIVIDGQHRLGGYFYSKSEEISNMEVPIVILFGPSLSVASKIFIDINKNQKSVDSSMIYDLTAVLEEEYDDYKLKGKAIGKIRDCHNIIKALNSNEKSPLYNNIRMLGTGEGLVSQSFLVEMIYPIITKSSMKELSVQEQLNEIYIFLKAIQRVFKDDWPILENYSNSEEAIEHYDYVMKYRKSQLPKTLGMSAMLNNLPKLFSKCRNNYGEYEHYLMKLKEKVVWSKLDYLYYEDDLRKIVFVEGTNKAAIKNLSNEIEKILFDKYN